MSDIKVGDIVEFTGYVDVDEGGQDDRVEVGGNYEVVKVLDDDQEDLAYRVAVPNPNKRAKKPILVDLFFDEVKLVGGGQDEPAEDVKEEAVTASSDDLPPDDFIDPDEAEVGTVYEVQMKDESVPVFVGTVTKATKTLLYVDDDKYKKADIDALFYPETGDTGKDEDRVEERKAVSSEKADKPPVSEKEDQPKTRDTEKSGTEKKRASTKKKSTTKKTAANKKAEPAKKEVAVPATEEISTDVSNEDDEVLALVEEADDLCTLAKECLEDTAYMEWRLGGVLHHVLQDKAYEALSDTYVGKGGFERYCINDLGIKYRKARYLINIYVDFSNAGLNGHDLARIGWTKARNLLKVLDENNAQELIALAEANTVESLVDEIKIMEEKMTPDKTTTEVGETAKKMSFKFHYYEDEASFIAQSLQQVMDAEGIETEAEAMYAIVTRYMTDLFEQ